MSDPVQIWVRNDKGKVWGPLMPATVELLFDNALIPGRVQVSMDGANFVNRFIYIILPHLARAITVVILIQTIYLLGVYAEILITTGGGPGFASTNLPFLIYRIGVASSDVGGGAAGGIIAVVLANIVAIFLMRAVGRNLDA